MRIQKQPRHPGIRLMGAIYGIIVLGFLAGGRLLDYIQVNIPECHFRRLTGIPCATCGSTRCYVSAAHGHLVRAFLYNPMMFMASLALLVWGAWSVYASIRKLPAYRVEMTLRERRIATISVVFLVLANWIYLIFTLPE